MFWRVCGTVCSTLLILTSSYPQAEYRRGLLDDSTLEQSRKPEAVGGKHYSKSDCVRIARWVTGDHTRQQTLTGIEVGNLWYVLDNCGFLYFSDRRALGERPSMEQIVVTTAID